MSNTTVFEYFNEKGHSFDMWDSELYPYVYYVESIVFVCYLLYIFTSIKDTCNHRWSRSKPASEPHCKTSQSLKSSYWQNVGFFLFPQKTLNWGITSTRELGLFSLLKKSFKLTNSLPLKICSLLSLLKKSFKLTNSLPLEIYYSFSF